MTGPGAELGYDQNWVRREEHPDDDPWTSSRELRELNAIGDRTCSLCANSRVHCACSSYCASERCTWALGEVFCSDSDSDDYHCEERWIPLVRDSLSSDDGGVAVWSLEEYEEIVEEVDHEEDE